jgi:hypothetical protein
VSSPNPRHDGWFQVEMAGMVTSRAVNDLAKLPIAMRALGPQSCKDKIS